MKACKKDLERTCNHGQHVLDKQDRDIYHAAINKHALDKHDCDITYPYLHHHLDMPQIASILFTYSLLSWHTFFFLL